MAKKPKPFKLTPPDPNEDQLQASIANLLDWVLSPEVQFTHFPAGGYQLTPAAQARLYRLGLKRGYPDLYIAYPVRKTLWMEVKVPKGTLSQAQKERHEQLQALGHVVVVVRSVDEALQALWTYGVPIRRARLDRSYHGTSYQSDATVSSPQLAKSTTASTEAIG